MTGFGKCVEIAQRVASAGKELRETRNKIRKDNNCSLRDLYRGLDLPGKNPLRDAQERLDKAVHDAYSYGLSKQSKSSDELKLLYMLNLKCAEHEASGNKIFGPGLPKFCGGGAEFYSTDCIRLLSKD